MRFAVLSLVFLMFALSVQAGEEPVDKMRSVHVDVREVAVTGNVAPVDGITSSGQPNAEAFQAFAEAGYAAVIDMRGADEDRGLDDEPAAVEALGMDYIPFPIEDGAEISYETAEKLDRILMEIDGPVLLHCGSGNRVGAILALRHSLNGASDEEALAHGRDAGMTGLESLVRERLSDD